jgi:VCBS repeat-containing protein
MSTIPTTTTDNLSSLSPSAGVVMYNTDNDKIYVYSGTDWVFYDNDGTFNPDGSTKYVEFDAVSDYATVDDHSSLNFGSGSFSISLWLNDGGNGEVYFKKGAYGGRIGWGLTTTSGKYNFITDSSTTAQHTLTSVSSLQSGFAHIVCVYDSTSGTKEIYINGSSDVSASHTMGSTDTTEKLFVGQQANGYGRACQIDEFAIFNTALSSSDVTSLYNLGQADASSTSGLVSYWRMGEGDDGAGNADGTIVYDMVGSNDMALISGATVQNF